MRKAFTLVELLVVIGIIAVLVGILLPTLSSARRQAQLTRCATNLSQINNATRMYANDNRDHYPDGDVTGNYTYRMLPGLLTPDDPGAKPEVYGLPAILHGIRAPDYLDVNSLYLQLPQILSSKYRYLPANGEIWSCPSAGDYIKQFGNTYNVNINSVVGKYTSLQRGKRAATGTFWVFDNYSSRPGLSGFRGPFGTGYVLATTQRVYPHKLKNKNMGATNVLFLDGHVALEQITAN